MLAVRRDHTLQTHISKSRENFVVDLVTETPCTHVSASWTLCCSTLVDLALSLVHALFSCVWSSWPSVCQLALKQADSFLLI